MSSSRVRSSASTDFGLGSLSRVLPGLTLAPRLVERPTDDGWTLVGTLDGHSPSRVDGAGLVTPEGAGWSLDWWIGADDRWYLPAREATVRQRRTGAGPVLETTIRIPSGDARQTVYGAIVAGREATVVEVYNDSPVPVALAIALRPYTVDALEKDCGIRMIQLDEREVRIGTGPSLVLPRSPNESGGSVQVDMLDNVLAGNELDWDHSGSGALPNGVLLYPLPHRTSLRFLVLAPDPTTELDLDLDELESGPIPVDAAPDSESVARGWNAVVDNAARFEFPDPGLTDLMRGARARLLMATPTLSDDVEQLRAGCGSVLSGLSIGAHHSDVEVAMAASTRVFPTRLNGSAVEAAAMVEAMSVAVSLSGLEPSTDLVESAAQLTNLIERNASKGRNRRLGRRSRASAPVDDGSGARAVALAHRSLAAIARLVGDEAGAAALEADLDPVEPVALEDVLAMVEQASPAGSWADDSAAEAGRFVAAARSLLIDDSGPGLVLAPCYPSSWRGGGAEVHRAPTRHGVLSFGIRWHGARPALLWDLEPLGRPALEPGPVVLSCPALDEGWSTTERRGETLLTGSAELLPDAPMPGDSFS